MSKNPNKRVLQTKKHLARLERERQQRKYLLIGISIVGVIVIGLIIFGILQQAVIEPSQPVAVVNDEKISTKQFQTQSRLIRYNLVRQAENTYQLAQYFSDDQATLGSLAGQLQQVAVQLEPTTLGQQVLDEMINDRIIRQEAEKLGITVTEEEIDKAIEAEFGYFPDGTPTVVPTTEILPTSTLSALQQTLVAPTATPTISTTITATATLAPTPTPTGIITPTATLSPTPTATPFLVEAYRKQYQDFIENVTSIANITEQDIRNAYASILFRDKVQREIVGEVTDSQEQVWARHILVADEPTAKQVVERLNIGEDFCNLALELSTDTTNNNACGDLGWFPKEQMVAEFADAAFALTVGEISDPVKSQFGWHIIQALGHENRPIDSVTLEQQKQQKFQEWLNLRRSESTIEQKNYWIDRVSSVPDLSLEIQSFIQQVQAAQAPPSVIEPTDFPQTTPTP